MAASCEESRLIKKIMNIHETLVPLQLITYSERFGRRHWCEWSDSTPTHRQLNKTQAAMFQLVADVISVYGYVYTNVSGKV